MESLSQVGLATVVLLCAGLCLGAVVILGVVLWLSRSGVVGGLLEGLGAAVRGEEDAGLPAGERPRASFYRGRRRRDVDSIRAEYDRRFQAQTGEESPLGDLEDAEQRPAYKRRYKRRFREENPDWDDEMDFYFDETEL